ncbi:unnamed protein product [Cylicocyclus nassatus]|uniref:Uncharacterized protein n=1 Tax=Cylicocyclus nassatus TaxID=53992 RepID=A0AA36H372_CYLNA|nr:unnamed protein product [Cylicocyclus nassatus]
MHCVAVFLSTVAVLAHGQVQNSGYENAEQVQPAPAPISASGGDQQAYNSDAAAPVAPASPPPPPPPPPPSPPAPVRGSYASPPPASSPPVQGSYGTSPTPSSYATLVPGSTYGPSSNAPVMPDNGMEYRHRRVFRHRSRKARL